jgi:PadR family transcriptional regulator AphA
MNYHLTTIRDQSFLECFPDGQVLRSDADILDLIVACGEQMCDRLLVHAGLLPTDFYDLKTGLAGNLLQKLVNYRLRCAFILDEEKVGNGRFYEMMIEANRGRQFHFCFNVDDALEWLVGLV